ncbi:MAG: hypothetical protein GVY25_02805 [Bacteroidetes bacterium]|nr:hypothetical protein [Bacteroidota bacterium]
MTQSVHAARSDGRGAVTTGSDTDESQPIDLTLALVRLYMQPAQDPIRSLTFGITFLH